MLMKLDIQIWLGAQRNEVQLGLEIPVAILNVWYEEGKEDPGYTMRVLEVRERLREKEVIIGVEQYLHLIQGDYPNFPNEVQEFLERSPALVVPILKELMRHRVTVNTLSLLSESRITVEDIKEIVRIKCVDFLFADGDLQKVNAKIAAFSDRMRYTVISEEVEARARRYLDSGEVSQRHPAYVFLTRLVDLAPSTRQLSATARELVEMMAERTPAK